MSADRTPDARRPFPSVPSVRPMRAELDAFALGLLVRDALRNLDPADRARVARLAGHVQDADTYSRTLALLEECGALYRGGHGRRRRLRLAPELEEVLRGRLYGPAVLRDADPGILGGWALDALEDAGTLAPEDRGGLPHADADALARRMSEEHGAAHVHLDADSTYRASVRPLGVRYSDSHVRTYVRGEELDLAADLLPFLDAEARAVRERLDAEEAARTDTERAVRARVEREELEARGYVSVRALGFRTGRYTAPDGADVSHADACERERLRVELEELDLADVDEEDREELESVREEAQEDLLARVEDEGRAHGTVRTVRAADGRAFLAVDTYAPEPTDAQRAAERAERFGLDAAEVLDGFARTAWADAYGSAVERAAEPEEEERAERARWTRPNLSGCALEDLAPERVRGDFLGWARPIVRAVLLAVPDDTLRAWGEHTDARNGGAYAVGASLYLDAVGHGAGLADLDLPRATDGAQDGALPVSGLPYSGGLPRAFGALEAPLLDWTELPDADGEHALPLAEDLLARDVCSHPAGRRSAEGAASAVAGLLHAWRTGTVDAEEVLAHADRILGGFGVEELDLPAPTDEDRGGSVRYVNRGDTYTGTLLYVEDADGERFLAADWGSVLEGAEEERTLHTGETRCAYCGAWGLGGLDAAGLDFRPLDGGGFPLEECEECGHGAE